MAPRKTKTKTELPLLGALNFIKLAQREDGALYQTHCRMFGKFIIAYDGILACGIQLTEDDIELPYVCPNTYRLIHAIERANDVSSIAFENNAVTVRTSKFRAVVPTIMPENLVTITPDPASWPLNNNFRDAIARASVFTREGAQTVIGASVYCTNGSCIGTNSLVIVQAWHGVGMPDLIVPKTFVDALVKIKKDITRFGYSDTSLTVWFDDNTWLKTQLYSEPWPTRSVNGILSEIDALKCDAVPKDFWEGIRSIAPFAHEQRVHLDNELLATTSGDAEPSATYKVKGLDATDVIVNYKQFLAIEEFNPAFNFNGNERLIAFIGDGVRGAISKIRA